MRKQTREPRGSVPLPIGGWRWEGAAPFLIVVTRMGGRSVVCRRCPGDPEEASPSRAESLVSSAAEAGDAAEQRSLTVPPPELGACAFVFLCVQEHYSFQRGGGLSELLLNFDRSVANWEGQREALCCLCLSLFAIAELVCGQNALLFSRA